MEPNTVILDVNIYNELRDFKNEISKGNTYTISNFFSSSRTFISTDEAVKIIAKENAELREQLKALQTPKEISINDLKKMSYWKFRNWQRNQL